MSKQNIAETVRALISDTIASLGYEIWDVEYVKEGADYYLRITIDSENGIDIDDCEKVHRAIDPMLDEADPIEDSYCLQVSSPGIERVLRTDEHLNYAVGTKVDAKLFKAENKLKAFTAVLKGFNDKQIIFFNGEADFSVERSNVSRLSVHFDFDD